MSDMFVSTMSSSLLEIISTICRDICVSISLVTPGRDWFPICLVIRGLASFTAWDWLPYSPGVSTTGRLAALCLVLSVSAKIAGSVVLILFVAVCEAVLN
ncbi:hypothetical protein DPMN_143284 [Dreissena polymorpha]|uniref:Uncharacterized protein n=1 Tax=Dreissena polymorpha TaxID=45954 RepID=A0A9D4JLK3_DREPO|nr:hypothetical protein DPMN_143284 [Dreissena polymorpha]